MFDNMTRRRADTVSTCGNGPSLWRPRAVRQSLPAFECGYACGCKHSAAGDSGRGYFQATIWRDRASSHKLTMPRLWVGSDRLAEFAESKQSDGYEHPAQLDKRICMDIPPIIETRRAKRRTAAAYQHRRRRSLTGGHSITPMRVAWSTNARIACSLRIRSQDLPPSHGPIELRCPGNGRFPPMSAPLISVSFLKLVSW